MSETNEDLLTYDLGNDDPAMLNEDELLLSDEEGGIKIDQQDEEFLLSESEEWVSKQLSTRECDSIETPAGEPVKIEHEPPQRRRGGHTAGAAESKDAVTCENSSGGLREPHTSVVVASAVHKEHQEVSDARTETSMASTAEDNDTEADCADSVLSQETATTDSKSLSSVATTAVSESMVGGSQRSSDSRVFVSPARSNAESMRTTLSGGSTRSERIAASQQCDTTSSEDVNDLYTSGHNPSDLDHSYDTDESNEKRGWKNETKGQDQRHTAVQQQLHHHQQQQHHHQQQQQQQHHQQQQQQHLHGPGNRQPHPGGFGKPVLKHPLLAPGQQQPHAGMGNPLLGPHGGLAGFGLPLGGNRIDFRTGGNRPRFPVRPNFPPEMNQYRGIGRMNFPPGGHPPGVHPPPGPMGPRGLGMPIPHRGFPQRPLPFDMMRPVRPGDRAAYEGMRLRPLVAANAGGPMYRGAAPLNGPTTGGTGVQPGGPRPAPGSNGPQFGPHPSQMQPNQSVPVGQIGGPNAAAVGGVSVAPPQSLLSGTFDPMSVGGKPLPAIVTPAVAPFPQKVLINPNFKGGVEAVKNQLMRDAALNSQQFVASVSSVGRQVSDEELLRQQEEFINKNRIEVEKRRQERSPSPSRERDRDRERERERERDRARSRERETRERERERERDRDRERERDVRSRDRETRARSRDREYSPRRAYHRAAPGGESRERELAGRPRRNFGRGRNESRERDDDHRFPKRRKSGDYGDNHRGNHERNDDDEDPETRAYRIEIEKQKATREKMLREKEMRRKRAAEEKLKSRSNESKPQENTPPKLTPLVVTEKKIITLKKKPDPTTVPATSTDDEMRHRHADTERVAHHATSKSNEQQHHGRDGGSRGSGRSTANDLHESNEASTTTPVDSFQRQRQNSELTSEAIELDLLEELLLREPTPEPMPTRPKTVVTTTTTTNSSQVTTTTNTTSARAVIATSSSTGSSNSPKERSGGARRIVLKPMASGAAKKDRQEARIDQHHQQQQQHHHHHHHQQSATVLSGSKRRIFDRLDKRIGVNEADKQKIQRLVKHN
ncbi:protein split ends [Anopheles cruzii]|uniref:protein split ends n=1 Tax=Anopheles cruzii TaxID=68878 RepID=UPI0022EC5A6B|nr:protein split ends [Anopheles cruzii]